MVRASPRATLTDSERLARPAVTNTGNPGVEVFTTSAASVRSDRPSPAASAAPVRFVPDGGMSIGAHGLPDSVLVRVFSQDGTALAGVRDLLARRPTRVCVTVIKANAEQGNVPAMFRNFARPMFAADGGLWVVLTAEGVLRRYDEEGRQLWSVPLDAPELPRIRQAFFDRNRELAGEPARFVMLSYVQDAQLVERELWLLLDTPAGESSVVLVFSDRGTAAAGDYPRGRGGRSVRGRPGAPPSVRHAGRGGDPTGVRPPRQVGALCQPRSRNSINARRISS